MEEEEDDDDDEDVFRLVACLHPEESKCILNFQCGSTVLAIS